MLLPGAEIGVSYIHHMTLGRFLAAHLRSEMGPVREDLAALWEFAVDHRLAQNVSWETSAKLQVQRWLVDVAAAAVRVMVEEEAVAGGLACVEVQELLSAEEKHPHLVQAACSAALDRSGEEILSYLVMAACSAALGRAFHPVLSNLRTGLDLRQVVLLSALVD